MKQDGVNRMHAHWHYNEVDQSVIQQQTYSKPETSTKPHTKPVNHTESPATIFAAVKIEANHSQPVAQPFGALLSPQQFTFLPESPGQPLPEGLPEPHQDSTTFTREASSSSIENRAGTAITSDDLIPKPKSKTKNKPKNKPAPQTEEERALQMQQMQAVQAQQQRMMHAESSFPANDLNMDYIIADTMIDDAPAAFPADELQTGSDPIELEQFFTNW